ncbi:hypothetical protein D9Q98_008860 [Chlorella vulgaris]|uniref:Uncharacterized protein n=1 Tax=Chlorella vulgaris TaxID=3077 RepID=A0A9D4YUD2_CHLVU|nr:hypothetical protein D9Q98_008860 [Chlorella vulgaris]
MQTKLAFATAVSAPSGFARRPAATTVITPLRFVQQRQRVTTQALGDSSNNTTSSKTTLRREDEPEEYWKSQAEKDGKSPFEDPLAQIGLLAIFFPFIFLAAAIAFGWVDLSAGR